MQLSTPHPPPYPHAHPQPQPHQTFFAPPQPPHSHQYQPPTHPHPHYAQQNASHYQQQQQQRQQQQQQQVMVASGMAVPDGYGQIVPPGGGIQMPMGGGVGIAGNTGAVASGSGSGSGSGHQQYAYPGTLPQQHPSLPQPHPQSQPQAQQHPHPQSYPHPHPPHTRATIAVAPGSGIVAQRHPRIPGPSSMPVPASSGGMMPPPQPPGHIPSEGVREVQGRARGWSAQSQRHGFGGRGGRPPGMEMELDLEGVQWIPQGEMEVITPGGTSLRQASQTSSVMGRTQAQAQMQTQQQILSIAQGRNQALTQAQMEAMLQQELRSGRVQGQGQGMRQGSVSSVVTVQAQQEEQVMGQQTAGGFVKGRGGQGQVNEEGYTLVNEAGEVLAQIPSTGLLLPFDHGTAQKQQPQPHPILRPQQITNEAGQTVPLPAWMRGDARGAYQYLASDGRSILPMSGPGAGVMPSPSMGGTGMELPEGEEEAVMVQQGDGSVIRMLRPAGGEEGRNHATGQAEQTLSVVQQQTPRMAPPQAQLSQASAGPSQASSINSQHGNPFLQIRRPDYQIQNEYGSVSSQAAQSHTSRILSEGPEVASPINMIETKRAGQAALGLGAPATSGVSFPDLHASLQAMEGEGMRSFQPGDLVALVGRDVDSLSGEEQTLLMDHGFRVREVMNEGRVVRVVETPEHGSVVQELVEEVVEVNPAMAYGQANMRMAHFFEGLRRICETRSHALAVAVTHEYFVPDAVFTVIRKGATGADVTNNNLPQCILPRWFMVMHDPNVRRTAWTLTDPVETYLRSVDEPTVMAGNTSPEGVLLETEGLSWAKYYDNGSVIISHGVGRSIWRIDPATKMLKMYRLEIAFDYHDDLIERSAAEKLVETQRSSNHLYVPGSEPDTTSPSRSMPLPTPPSSISGQQQHHSFVAGSRTKLEQQFPQLKKGTTAVDSHDFAGEAEGAEGEMGGQRGGRAGLPISPQAHAPFGIPQQATRFLELATTFNQMMPIIGLFQREKMSRARDALRQHVARGRAGIKTSSTAIEGMPLDLRSRVMLTPTQVPSAQPPFPVPTARPQSQAPVHPAEGYGQAVMQQTPRAMTRGLSVQTEGLPNLTPANYPSSLPQQYIATPVSVVAQTPGTVTGATPLPPGSSVEIASNLSVPAPLPLEADKVVLTEAAVATASVGAAATRGVGNSRKRKATVITTIEGENLNDLNSLTTETATAAEKRALANAPANPVRKGPPRKRAKKA